MRTFALVGRNISYSFSRRYFAEKFAKEQIANCEYINFDISTIEELPTLIRSTPTLAGMNVTIPYKEAILPLLDEQDDALIAIKACNTIKLLPSGKLKGYNTDYIGFRDSLVPYLKPHHHSALILGTGGASKAVAFALDQLEIPCQLVSRERSTVAISYKELTQELIEAHLIYNPERTAFLCKGAAQGATILNGYPMLVLQAEAAWKIWNNNL